MKIIKNNIFILVMKNYFIFLFVSVFSLLALGCATRYYVEQSDGTKQSVVKKEDGAFYTPAGQAVSLDDIKSEKVFDSETTFDLVESVSGAVSDSGGILGLIGAVLGGGIAIWRRRKEKGAVATAVSVVEGASEVLKKVNEMKENGTLSDLSEKDLLEILKKVQNDSGTREAVKKILDSLLNKDNKK